MTQTSQRAMISLDMPITLRKCARTCTKHSMCNYMSYSNLSPKFRAFASLDTTIIPKNIREATKSPEWKMVVMEEMGAFEKNKT